MAQCVVSYHLQKVVIQSSVFIVKYKIRKKKWSVRCCKHVGCVLTWLPGHSLQDLEQTNVWWNYSSTPCGRNKTSKVKHSNTHKHKQDRYCAPFLLFFLVVLHNMYNNHVLFSLLACDKKIVEHDIKNGRLFLGCDVQSWKASIHLRHRIQVQIEANQPNTILTFTSSRIVFGSYKLLRKKNQIITIQFDSFTKWKLTAIHEHWRYGDR